MTRKAMSARSEPEETSGFRLGLMSRRILWIGLAGFLLFLTCALVSFDSADWPSHMVAVHNEPSANLCGSIGAIVAYWAYYLIGVGSWIVLAGLAGYLIATVRIGHITHSGIRLAGLCLMAVAFSCMHGLLLTDLGPITGAPAGLLAEFFVAELSPRFSTVGSFLILLAGFGIGAVIAVDKLLFALPRALVAVVHSIRAVPLPRFPQFSLRFGRKSKEKKSRSSWFSRRPGIAIGTPIDPDAGGVGATDAFDPEEYETDDEYEYEDDEEEEYEDEEYEDEEEPEEQHRLTAEELREKISKLPLRMAGKDKTVARDEDIPRQESFEGYQFPTLDLLGDPEANYSEKMENYVRKQAERLEESLQTYGIDGEVVGIDSGPAVTLYSVQLAPGTKVAKVSAIASDLARSLKAQSIRIVPNMAGRTTVGIEVPNLHRERVRIKELMNTSQAENMTLPMFLGKDASGEALVADLTKMPHMLIAGTTGSGKSVCMNSIIMSWLYTKRPDELKLVLVDPKMVELSQFSDIPHLMCPVVTESARAAAILEWAVNKMEERYELLREARVRDLAGYNALEEEELYELFQPSNDEEKARIPKRLPHIVFVIDELADMMLTHKEVEQHIVRIAQKARAVGLHLILATQRPQANVVTGLIKSNMPCRVSFKVSSGMDSRIVLDQKGAEVLLGQGDMLFLSPHTTELRRAQGTLVEDREIRRVAKFLKEIAAPSFERSLMTLRTFTETDHDGEVIEGKINEKDPLFDRAVEIMIETGRGSVSLLQRHLAIGYTRASRLVEQMSQAGILGDHKGSVAREVMISMHDWQRLKAMAQEAEDEGELSAEVGEMDEYDDDADLDEIDEPEIIVESRSSVPIHHNDQEY